MKGVNEMMCEFSETLNFALISGDELVVSIAPVIKHLNIAMQASTTDAFRVELLSRL